MGNERCGKVHRWCSLAAKWYRNARPRAIAQSLMPSLLAVTIAAGNAGFRIIPAVVAVFGVLCAHLGMNLADDWFDYKTDMLSDRDRVIRKGFRAMMTKYSYLTDGSASPADLATAIFTFFGIAGACCATVFIYWGMHSGLFTVDGSWWVAAITGACAFLGLFYSAPPLKLAYRGLGEIVIGIIFGPLLMCGVHYSACGTISAEVVWISVPVGLLVLNILFTHSFIEKESDAESNKMTLVRLIDSDRANMAAVYIINFLPFLMIAGAVAAGRLHPAYLAVMLMVPRSCYLCSSLGGFARGVTEAPERPPRWLGPMPGWEGIRQRGTDWFLLRWMTARNILSGFCLIILAVRLSLIAIEYFI